MLCKFVYLFFFVLLSVFELYSQSSNIGLIEKYGMSLDATAFFRNDEYATPVINDYTLPGYKLRISGFIDIGKDYKLEMRIGAETLAYWGANRYPTAIAYRDFAYWTGKDEGKKINISPIFSLTFVPFNKFSVLLGSFQPDYAEKLLEPIYNPELRYMSDVANGVFAKYVGDKYSMTTFIDWQSFIFIHEKHPEAFTFAHISQYNIIDKKDKLYTELQLLASHRGGKINDVLPDTVHSWLNATFGFGGSMPSNILDDFRYSLSSYALLYMQRGEHYPVNRGYGFYTKTMFNNKSLAFSIDGLWIKNYVSPWGVPFSRVFDKNDKFYNNNHSLLYIKPSFAYTYKGHGVVFRSELGFWFLPVLRGGDKFSHYIDVSISTNIEILFSHFKK